MKRSFRKRNYSYEDLNDMVNHVYHNYDSVTEYADTGEEFYRNILDALENEYNTTFNSAEQNDILDIVKYLYEDETGESFQEDDEEEK